LNEPFSASLPQTQCLRVVTFIVRETVSRNRTSRSGNIFVPNNDAGQAYSGHVDTSDTAERAVLIKVSYEALGVMQGAFNESSREDLRAVAVALYSGIVLPLMCQLII
jgi:hypothetical protein